MHSSSPFSFAKSWKNLLLVLAGAVTLLLYRVSLRAHVGNDITWFLKVVLAQAAIYVISLLVILRMATARSTLLIVITFAVLFRLSLLFSPPYLSDDVYRYVWDGRVQAARINPYRYVPADPALEKLRDDQIYPKINRRDYAHTIYPPLAEAVFLVATRISETVTAMKATMVLFEALGVWALAQLLAAMKLPRQRILIYAWHPLTVWEFSGSGHADAIAIGLIAVALLARYRHSQIGAGLGIGGATLAKSFPAVLLPAFYKQWDWKLPLVFVATVVIGYVPYIAVGPAKAMIFLFGQPPERGIESGQEFFILSAVRQVLPGIPTTVFVIFACIVGVVIVFWMFRRQAKGDQNYITHGLIIASVFVVLVSPHFPWYFAWLIPFLCFAPSPAVIYMTLASFLLYLTWLGDTTTEVLKMKAGIFVPALILIILSCLRRRRVATVMDPEST